MGLTTRDQNGKMPALLDSMARSSTNLGHGRAMQDNVIPLTLKRLIFSIDQEVRINRFDEARFPCPTPLSCIELRMNLSMAKAVK